MQDQWLLLLTPLVMLVIIPFMWIQAGKREKLSKRIEELLPSDTDEVSDEVTQHPGD